MIRQLRAPLLLALLALTVPAAAQQSTFAPRGSQSLQKTPGIWTTYQPTVAAASGAITTLGTITGRYQTIGKRVDAVIDYQITTNGTAGGYLGVSLPVASRGYATCSGGEQSVGPGKGLRAIIQPASTNIVVLFADGTYPGANGSRGILSCSYEIN